MGRAKDRHTIDVLAAEDHAELLAAAPLLAARSPGPADLSGWLARDGFGAVAGAVVDLPGRVADGLAGAWFASSGRVFDDLYTVAARAWVDGGTLTHRVVLDRGNVLEASLLALGFGHQQAHAHAPLATVAELVPRGAPQVDVRPVAAADLSALVGLAPLVSRHQGGAPAFAPRTEEFFAQLPASLAAGVQDGELDAWLAWDGATAAGFVLVEHDEDVTEVVLAGTRDAWRGRGVAHALLASVVDAARARGTTRLRADWRTANRLADRFWPSLGFVVEAHRWCRTVDLTPT